MPICVLLFAFLLGPSLIYSIYDFLKFVVIGLYNIGTLNDWLYNSTVMIRTRIGPSPTGFPHIGTIYQALFNKAFAVKNNGKFISRTEDTDQNRYVEGAEEALNDAFEWFGLMPDESIFVGGDYGPYRQSERLSIYKEYVDKLIASGHAYYCFCSAERLEEVRNEKIKNKQVPMYDQHCRNLSEEEVKSNLEKNLPYVVRMKVPSNETIVCNDLVRGDIKFDSNIVDDQVILKSDGYPTYHLAVVADDTLMKISHVLRGPEWLSSFPKHKLLYDYLGLEMPVFTHSPLVVNMDGSKLSKRQGHASVNWYRKKGFLPETILNFIALLGWSHPEEKEIFSLDEFIKVFDFKDLSAVSPKFDLQKLLWMNGQYIKDLSNEEFINRLIEWLRFNLDKHPEDLSKFESSWTRYDYEQLLSFIESLDLDKKLLFAEINRERVKVFEDLLPMNSFFIKDIELNQVLLNSYKNGVELKNHLNWFRDELVSINDWSLNNIKELEAKVKDRSVVLGWKILEVFYPIRIVVCRDKVSPPLFESIYILGKEKTLERFIGV